MAVSQCPRNEISRFGDHASPYCRATVAHLTGGGN